MDAPLESKARQIGEQLAKENGLLCKVLYQEAKKDPTTAAAMRVMQNDIGKDVIAQIVPGVRAYSITKDLAQRASDKLGNSDYIGAVADYSAVVALGITSATPLAIGSDLTQELLRATGVDVPHSPVVNAYNTVSGLYKVCSVAEKRLLPYIEYNKATGTNTPVSLPAGNATLPTPPDPDKLFEKVDLTDAQREALRGVAQRAIASYETVQRDQLQQIPGKPAIATPESARR